MHKLFLWKLERFFLPINCIRCAWQPVNTGTRNSRVIFLFATSCCFFLYFHTQMRTMLWIHSVYVCNKKFSPSIRIASRRWQRQYYMPINVRIFFIALSFSLQKQKCFKCVMHRYWHTKSFPCSLNRYRKTFDFLLFHFSYIYVCYKVERETESPQWLRHMHSLCVCLRANLFLPYVWHTFTSRRKKYLWVSSNLSETLSWISEIESFARASSEKEKIAGWKSWQAGEAAANTTTLIIKWN